MLAGPPASPGACCQGKLKIIADFACLQVLFAGVWISSICISQYVTSSLDRNRSPLLILTWGGGKVVALESRRFGLLLTNLSHALLTGKCQRISNKTSTHRCDIEFYMFFWVRIGCMNPGPFTLGANVCQAQIAIPKNLLSGGFAAQANRC